MEKKYINIYLWKLFDLFSKTEFNYMKSDKMEKRM